MYKIIAMLTTVIITRLLYGVLRQYNLHEKAYNYICSYLDDINLAALEQIEAFNKGDIPNQLYS